MTATVWAASRSARPTGRGSQVPATVPEELPAPTVTAMSSRCHTRSVTPVGLPKIDLTTLRANGWKIEVETGGRRLALRLTSKLPKGSKSLDDTIHLDELTEAVPLVLTAPTGETVNSLLDPDHCQGSDVESSFDPDLTVAGWYNDNSPAFLAACAGLSVSGATPERYHELLCAALWLRADELGADDKGRTALISDSIADSTLNTAIRVLHDALPQPEHQRWVHRLPEDSEVERCGPLVRDAVLATRGACGLDAAWDPVLLTATLLCPDWGSRYCAARLPELAHLAMFDEDVEVAACGASALTDVELLDHCVGSLARITCGAAKNPLVHTCDSYDTILHSWDWDIAGELAENPNTTDEMLSVIVELDSISLAEQVALHPNTSAETLAFTVQLHLNSDGYTDHLVGALRAHPNTSVETHQLIDTHVEACEAAGETFTGETPTPTHPWQIGANR